MAHKVFICHSSNDKLVADAACAALEAQRIPCWIAPRDILAGEEYGESIVDALSGCQIVLLIFSRDANNSPQVRREIERAVSKGKIIVPFRIEDVMPSRAMEFALSNTHWLDALTPPMERYLLQLCDTIARLIQKHTVAEAPLWKPPEPVVVETIVKPEPIPVQAKASQEPVAAELGKKPEPLWEQTKPSPEIPSEETGKKAEPFTQEAKATAKPTVEPTPEAADSRSAKEEIGESKSGWRRVPGWAWGVLAVVVLAGVFAAVQLFGPLFLRLRHTRQTPSTVRSIMRRPRRFTIWPASAAMRMHASVSAISTSTGRVSRMTTHERLSSIPKLAMAATLTGASTLAFHTRAGLASRRATRKRSCSIPRPAIAALLKGACVWVIYTRAGRASRRATRRPRRSIPRPAMADTPTGASTSGSFMSVALESQRILTKPGNSLPRPATWAASLAATGSRICGSG